jgi:hypothetical protein
LVSSVSIKFLSIMDFILSGLKLPDPSIYKVFLLLILFIAQIEKLIWVFPVPLLPAISIR